MRISAARPSCWAGASLSFLAISSWAWSLRDGLGPDSVQGRGWAAFVRYFNGTGWSLLVPAALLIAGLFLYRSDADRAGKGP